MITRCTLVVLLISTCIVLHAQDSLKFQDHRPETKELRSSEMGRFSLSVNPAGVIMFGPMLNAEVGLGKHVRFNTHIRFPQISMYRVMYWMGVESLEGYGIGGGIMGFFGKQESRHKPYVGLLMEYSKTTSVDYNDPNSSYYNGNTSTDRTYVVAIHAGYRFRFRKGFFIQTGIYMFLPFYPDFPKPLIPLPQPDIRFGFEF